MCGIVGFIRKEAAINVGLCNSFEQIWWGTQLRGIDGCGIFQVNRDDTIDIEKSAYTPDYAVLEKNISTLLANVDMEPFSVAHCRAATKQPAKRDDKWLKRNAHPFKHKHISLVHNGYFSYVGQDHIAHEVDSENFTHAVADLGFEAAIKKAYGAFAIIYYDEQTKKLNIARNEDRPLFRVEHPLGHFYVSEAKLALWILDRNKLQAPTAIVEVEPHKLISYEAFNLEFETKDIAKPVSSTYYPRGGDWIRDAYGDYEDIEYDRPTHVITASNYSRPSSNITNNLSFEEVLSRMGRFCWEDAVWVAKHRASPVGWAPKIAKDYEEILSTSNKEAAAASSPLPLIQVTEKNGQIEAIYQNNLGFHIAKNVSYTFSIDEIHEHKSFVSIIGRPQHSFAHNKVRIVGNMNVPISSLKEEKRMLEGQVRYITKTKEKDIFVYTVYMADLKVSQYYDVRKFKKESTALVTASNADDGKVVNLNDIIVCPGCRQVTRKDEMSIHKHELFRDDQGRVTTTITINVCPDCIDEAEEDFDTYYQKKYLVNANSSKGIQ